MILEIGLETLRYNVKLWIVNKFVELNRPENIVYEFPEEFKPELDTEEESKQQKPNAAIAKYDVDLSDLIHLKQISGVC